MYTAASSVPSSSSISITTTTNQTIIKSPSPSPSSSSSVVLQVATTTTKMGRRSYHSSKKKQAKLYQSNGPPQQPSTAENDLTAPNGSLVSSTAPPPSSSSTVTARDVKSVVNDPNHAQLWSQEGIKNDIIRYLNFYRRGCYDYYNSNITKQQQSQQRQRHGILKSSSSFLSYFLPSSSSSSSSPVSSSTRGSSIVDDISVTSIFDVCTIGNVQFPLLLSSLLVFQQPYLILPCNLTSKQRKLLHICCLQLDLYHDSVNVISTEGGDTAVEIGVATNDSNIETDHEVGGRLQPLQQQQQQQNRSMVISCYVDGFDYLPSHLKEQLQPLPPSNQQAATTTVVDLHLYKPWYCRRSDKSTSTGSSSGTTTGGNININNISRNYHDHDSNEDVPSDVGTPTKSNCTTPTATTTTTTTTMTTTTTTTTTATNGTTNTGVIANSSSSSLSDEKVAYTKQMKDQIWALIDQPGDCIRDGTTNTPIDTISYQQLHNKNLSNYNYQNIKTTSFTLVDSPYKMRQCVTELNHPDITEIAFDLESHSRSNYKNSSSSSMTTAQITCLIQITSNLRKEYIIDPLAPGVWDEIQQLQSIFANPKIVKIGHAIGSLDVPSLYRDFGIVIVNAFDTYEAARCIPQISPYGLAGLCQYYYLPHAELYQQLKDTYQTCNWCIRPLTPDMMLYGRMDIHYLINLRQLLIRDMILSYSPSLWNSTVSSPPKTKKKSVSISLPSDRTNASLDNNNNNNNNNTKMVAETDAEIPKMDETVKNLVRTTSASATDEKMNGDPTTGKLDEGEHTTTSIGDDPFLSEVHYNKLIPTANGSNGLTAEVTKNRDVFDFLARIAFEEDNGGDYVVPTVTSVTGQNYDDDDDDDEQTVASYNTAFQSLHPKSLNGSLSGSLNYNSDALYNTCTEDEDEEDDDDKEDEALLHEPKDITPEELRFQPIVMQCLSISQERCLNLWNDKKQEENHLKNELYQSMLLKKSLPVPVPLPTQAPNGTTKQKKKKSTKRMNNQASLTVASTTNTTLFNKEKDTFTNLYAALVEWRKYVASEHLECLPGFVVSLDYLVNVAHKRPMTVAGLQLISHQLPHVLLHNENIRDSLLDVVIRETMVLQQFSIPTATIYYYSNLTRNGSNTDRNGGEGDAISTMTSNALADAMSVKVLVAGSLSFGFIVSFYSIIKENPQSFQVLPTIKYLQQRIPIYMNHFMQQEVPGLLNQLRPYVPAYFKKK